MGRVALHLGAVLLIGAAPARAVANDDGIENIEVRGWSSRAAALAPKPDASLSLDARALRVEMLGDVVGEMPGVSLVRQGGLGASQFISIRGADFDQTVVLFDDVPLTGPDRGAVDFSLIPLDGFDRIELFRGSAPIRYGMGAIGGVVRLVPKEAQRDAATVSGSTGSFDTRQVRGVVEAGQGDWSFVSAGSGLWSQNNFSYLDDNATFADPTDDRKVERINADLAQGSGFAAARWERDAHRWALVGMVVHQGRGLPGPATVVSPDSRQTRTRVLTSLGYRYRGRPPRRTDAFATVAVGFDEARVRDLFGRVGLGREDSKDRYLSVDARGGAFVDVWPWLTLGATTFFRRDDIRPNDRFATPGDQPSSRDQLVAAAESHVSALFDTFELSLRGSASVQSTWARRGSIEGRINAEPRLQQTVPNFRVEATANFASSLNLSVLLASGTQLPTTLQLFGNRDTIVANPSLVPERSLSIDAGMQYARAFAGLFVQGSARLFLLSVEDIIVARRTATNTVVFRNEQAGQTWGAEMAFDVKFGRWLASTTSLTLLDSRFDNAGFDRKLPLRVPVRLFQRWTGHLMGDALSAFAEIDHRSAFFTDAANQVEQPALTSFNVGFEAFSSSDGLRMGLYVRNLFDALGQDLLAFPLPGRAFHISIQWRESL